MKKVSNQKKWLLLVFLIIMSSCTNNDKSDAYGQFEATETIISSKASGELLSFTPREGSDLKAGQRVGFVDTTQLELRKAELQAQLEATRSKIENINAEVEVQKEQLQTAIRNLNRTEVLVKDSAATQQQLDDVKGRVGTLRKQITALQTQKNSVRAEINAMQARLNQLDQQLNDTRIVNPVNGTVLTTYVELHELISQGQPLYQIANLDTLELRIYISGAQLPSIKLGQNVEVLVDKDADENQQLSGQINWIASEAEFTPKMIQTKEERVTQVYAVKVKVPNPDGILKIGMPGEVNF
jgi:HlyD family secretion protein